MKRIHEELIQDITRQFPKMGYIYLPDCRCAETVVCNWNIDADGVSHTQCKEAWICYEGTPKENGMNYCPYCGGILIQHEYVEETGE